MTEKTRSTGKLFSTTKAASGVASFITGILAMIFLVASVLTSVKALAQESDDAMNDFLNDAPVEDAAAPAANSGGTAAKGAKPATPGETKPEGDVVDMRLEGDGASTVNAVVPEANPALDKLEALMIADAEMKSFMKAGGLRSRLIK
jgi:hypothetical protein